MTQSNAAKRIDVWVPLSQIDWPHAALAFNVSYAGYLIPVNIGADDLRLRVSAESIDCDQSYVVYERASAVGMVLIARRGTASRLAAIGVAPQRRRSGLGRAMLEHAIAEAVSRQDLTMELEVIGSNTAALTLYEKMGFRTIDRLLGFELKTEPTAAHVGLRREGVERIVAALGADTSQGLPWQLAAASLAGSAPNWTVVSKDDTACAMVDLSRDDAVLLRLLHTPPTLRKKGSARRLLDALVVEAAGRPIRVAQLIPARYEEFAHHLGFETSKIHQHRMMLAPG